ncbi:MAG: VWA domain-containing protein [Acidobacteriota bacterium]
MARREMNVFSLSFLDAMTCGFGAVILFFMVINASAGLRAGRMTADLQGEVDRLDTQVFEGNKNLVELRNSLREVAEQASRAQGLSAQIIEQITALRAELATYDQSTLARREHINQLAADLKSLEEGARRLSGGIQSQETPGRRIRSFIGDGNRQYLTGLKIGGKRIAILVDASASMLDATLVNIIRRRNLPDDMKIRAEKWQQAVSTVDWLTTQIPRDSRFQVYTFNEEARSVVPGADGQWLDGGDRKVLDEAVDNLRRMVPEHGTNLYRGLAALKTLQPAPDNVILLVDGLPTQGASEPRGRSVSGKQRVKLFTRALPLLPAGVPVNVILFPMEGDPMAASAYWRLALSTRGSFLSPSRDWP